LIANGIGFTVASTVCAANTGLQSDGVAAARSSVTPLCVSYLPDQWAVAEEAGSINVPAGKLPVKFGYLVQLLPSVLGVVKLTDVTATTYQGVETAAAISALSRRRACV
jgi:hypothetical protein